MISPNDPIFDALKGELIHSTSLLHFEKIVEDGHIKGMHSANPAGFGQRGDGFGSVNGPAISLSDLRKNSEDELISPYSNWRRQVFEPNGASVGNSHSRFAITILIKSGMLDNDLLYDLDRVKREYPTLFHKCGLPVTGKFIVETELLYVGKIYLSWFKSILAVCGSEKSEMFTFDVKDLDQIMRDLKSFESICEPVNLLGKISPAR